MLRGCSLEGQLGKRSFDNETTLRSLSHYTVGYRLLLHVMMMSTCAQIPSPLWQKPLIHKNPHHHFSHPLTLNTRLLSLACRRAKE
ncbi:hypothetical protein IF2G_07074 [Cordyceps javanica]|nr:hypothetical protein IF2G_07074 [Cordyceps javanica]